MKTFAASAMTWMKRNPGYTVTSLDDGFEVRKTRGSVLGRVTQSLTTDDKGKTRTHWRVTSRSPDPHKVAGSLPKALDLVKTFG